MKGTVLPGATPEVTPSRLPGGTITFLMSDIQGSTRLWEGEPAAMPRALKRHNEICNQHIKVHSGMVLRDRCEGDGFFAIFRKAEDAVAAAAGMQRTLWEEAWPTQQPVRVRIALHTGQADADAWDPVINRCARLRALAYGGQTLLSAATETLARDRLPDGASLYDLGVHRLRDLARPERIYQLTLVDVSADFPALRSLGAFRNNLPIQLTAFIGREREVAEVCRLLDDNRLLTLTGSAGCGKTRLALQVAANVVESFPDGVRVVDLAPVVEGSYVVQSVASILGAREQAERPLVDTVIEQLHSMSLLLVLDNCEHLIDESARFVSQALQTSPRLVVLATSREALNVPGEICWRVPSLSLPDGSVQLSVDQLAAFDATRLFIDRARLGRPNFTVSDRESEIVVELCRRLDGIPLAIELAAARVRSLSVEELLQRIENRFRLLTGGSRTALPRQQTLRAAVEWSYNLLSQVERTLFTRLSVFAGGFSLKAAEAVCTDGELEEGDVVEVLARLVDKSLVGAGEESGRPARFRLLESLRQYGEDRLAESGQADTARQHHAEYFLAVVREAETNLTSGEQSHWLERLEEDHDNLRAALRWATGQGGDLGLELVGRLAQFWIMRGYISEGQDWLSAALRNPSAGGANRARALIGRARLAETQKDYQVARSAFEESLNVLGEVGDWPAVAQSLNGLGVIAQQEGDHVKARSYYGESIAVARQHSDLFGAARALSNLGELDFEDGDYTSARTHYQEAITTTRPLGERWALAIFLGNLGDVMLEQGDVTGARAAYRESLTLRRLLADRIGVAFSLEAFAALAALEGRPEQSIRLAGAAARLRQNLGAPLYAAETARFKRWLELARSALTPQAAAIAWEEGSRLELEPAIEYALNTSTGNVFSQAPR